MAKGDRLGRYTLVELIAIGGMAEIWLARMEGLEGFEKLVVIKKIKPHLAKQPSFVKMFLNEAKLAAQLNHPHICQIFDLGKFGDSYFIAMEYIFGRDLSEIMPAVEAKIKTFPLEYAVKIIAQVCEGLYYAHGKTDALGNPLNIVHRDISPQNIFVSFDGNTKILDFGIAKAANQYDQTQQGTLKGKVAYMSPEQILGHPFDARSDIFSLGIVFYELITGYKLFTGDNELTVLKSIVDGNVHPPSYFNKDIPPELERIVLKALEKNPEDRYQNAWEMQRDLDALLYSFDFNPSNLHLANFLKQLFSEEIKREKNYLKKRLEQVIHDGQNATQQLRPDDLLDSLDDLDEENTPIPTDDDKKNEEPPTPQQITNSDEFFLDDAFVLLEDNENSNDNPENDLHKTSDQNQIDLPDFAYELNELSELVHEADSAHQTSLDENPPPPDEENPTFDDSATSSDTFPDLEALADVSIPDEEDEEDEEITSIASFHNYDESSISFGLNHLFTETSTDDNETSSDNSKPETPTLTEGDLTPHSSLRHETPSHAPSDLPSSADFLSPHRPWNPEEDHLSEPKKTKNLTPPHYDPIAPLSSEELFGDLEELQQKNDLSDELTDIPELDGEEKNEDSLLDESQILFTMRFRTREYEQLKRLANRLSLPLDQLLRELIRHALPHFEEKFDLIK